MLRLSVNIVGFAVFVLTLFGNTPRVQAVDIGVTPTSFSVNIGPGQSYDNVILLSNKESKSVKMKAFAQAFKPHSDPAYEGEVQFSDAFALPNESQYKLTVSPASFTLNPNETREVTFTVTTTKKTVPGGYYVGVVLETVPGGDAGDTMAAQFIASQITIPILTQVAGTIDERAEIIDFSTDKTSYDRGPVTFKLQMKNTGDAHFAPIGRVDILTPEGERLDTIPFKGSTVLPNDTRTSEIVWKKSRLPLGRKTAKVVLIHGDGTLEKETTFEVLPGSFASSAGTTVGGLLLVVLLLGLFSRRKKRRKTRRR